jgi:hypothetical protein
MADKADRKQMAKLYEERRGDVAGWKPAGKRIRASRGATSVFSVRFTQDELGSVQAAADREGVAVSAYIREAALDSARPQDKLELHLSATGTIDSRLMRRAAELSVA